MTTANRYLTSWESYWSSLSGAPGEIFWDADPAYAAQQDLDLFQSHVDPRLPLIDVGCGNGTQTRFLGSHFARVIGTEIAPAAVELAGKTNGAANVSYRLLDVLNPHDAQVLHDEIGDANIYLRAVLHQLSPADQPTAVQSIERLIGKKGTLYLVELSSAAEPFFAQLIQQYGPPPGLARVFQHQITPGMLHEDNLASLFPADRYTLLKTGPSHIRTVHSLPTGDVVKVPAFYAILRRRQYIQGKSAQEMESATGPYERSSDENVRSVRSHYTACYGHEWARFENGSDIRSETRCRRQWDCGDTPSLGRLHGVEADAHHRSTAACAGR